MAMMGSRSRIGWRCGPERRREERPHHADELQELSETFRLTVDRLAAAQRELEIAHQKALQAEIEKKQFYREVIRAVTHGKFELVDREDVPELGQRLADIPIVTSADYAAARKATRDASAAAGMTDDQADELVLAAGEAITNAIKHARDGRFSVYRTDDGVVLRVTDQGSGIHSQDLPAAILMPGFSTKVSLGMGYTLMLRLCDRVWLSTSPAGTVVQMEKKTNPPAEDAGFLEGPLGRL